MKKIKWYVKLILTAVYLIGFSYMQYWFIAAMDYVVTNGFIPDSYALGIIFLVIDVFLYVFVPYKIWKLK